jgi:hypothetical protein
MGTHDEDGTFEGLVLALSSAVFADDLSRLRGVLLLFLKVPHNARDL